MSTDRSLRARVRRSAVAAGLLCAPCLPGCGREEPAEQRRLGPAAENLLLVTFDTTRADRIGVFGHAAAGTPTLDALAARGVAFATCISSAPITLPAHATLLTGLDPQHHGARNNGTHHLPPEVTTLAEELVGQGFTTAAVVAAFVLDSRYGLDQGFDRYDDDLAAGASSQGFGFRETDARDVTDRALRWFAERPEGRWFLWVHYFDPHSDYAPPAEYARRFADPYDGEIAYADAQLGRLLAEVERAGQLESTLVVMTADHGEALGAHGETTHGTFVYDATTRVPLILSHPSLPQGLVLDPVVALADVAPTAVELLGLEVRAGLDGRSLVGLMRGVAEPARTAYSEAMTPFFNFGWSDLRSLRSADGRFVRAPRMEYYDLGADPEEEHNLFATAPQRAAALQAELAARLAAGDVDARLGSALAADPEALKQLAALGYASFEADDANERADPKDRIAVLEGFRRAEELLARGATEEALALYRSLVDANPESVTLRDKLAMQLVGVGRLQDALAVQLETLRLPGAVAENYMLVSDLERELGIDGWEARLTRAQELDPKSPAPWVARGTYVHLPADPAAARAAFERALELDSGSADAWVGLARVAATTRDAAAALEAAERALELDPGLADAWLILGNMKLASGASQEGRRALERASQLEPGNVRTRVILAFVHALEGDEAAALRELRAAREVDPAAFERETASRPQLRGLLQKL